MNLGGEGENHQGIDRASGRCPPIKLSFFGREEYCPHRPDSIQKGMKRKKRLAVWDEGSPKSNYRREEFLSMTKKKGGRRWPQRKREVRVVFRLFDQHGKQKPEFQLGEQFQES